MSSHYIASLTSHPPRFHALPIALDSLAKQILQPQEVLLNIAHSDAQALPIEVTSRIARGEVRLNLCDDLGPAKKLIPAISEFPTTPIIVVDDDLVLEPDLTLKIMVQHALYPNSIIASRSHRITVDSDGNINPYDQWSKQWAIDNGPSADIFATAGAGTLFPPHAMHTDSLDENLYKELCFYTDDIWWYFHARRVGTNVRRVLGNRGLEFIEETQDEGLWRTGNKTRNDENFEKMQNRYGNPLSF